MFKSCSLSTFSLGLKGLWMLGTLRAVNNYGCLQLQVQAPTNGEALEGFNGEAVFRWQRYVCGP